MPTTDPVIVPIQGKDQLTPVVNKSAMAMREMGERVSQVGMRMTAAFTLPITLAVKGLVSFGQTSSKTLSDLNAAIGEANAGGDPVKIKAAWAAWNGLSPAVREAGIAYDRLQEALKPVNDEFDKAKASLLTALVPILKELTPTITSLARGISDLAVRFSNLPIGVQNVIVSSVALLAALGPMLVIFGQVINTVGTIQLLLPGLTAGLSGVGAASLLAAAPVVALVAAVGALVYLINSGEAMKAWQTLEKIVGMGLLKLGVINEQQFIAGSQNAGLIAPSAPGNGGMNVTINNNSPINTAQNDEAVRQIAKLMPSINRQLNH